MRPDGMLGSATLVDVVDVEFVLQAQYVKTGSVCDAKA
jgi:hypothetical protein